MWLIQPLLACDVEGQNNLCDFIVTCNRHTLKATANTVPKFYSNLKSV